MYLNSRWCCLISQFIVSSLSSEFHILMSYRVLIEWMNIHLENCLCSSFCQEHCGILKFPGATKLQYSISRIYSIYGRSYKQGACSTPGMQALCLFFNYLCSFIFFCTLLNARQHRAFILFFRFIWILVFWLWAEYGWWSLPYLFIWWGYYLD